MGIDYKIVNDTKKEYFNGETLYNGCSKHNATFYGSIIPFVLIKLLSNRWKGDKIRVLDDLEQQKEWGKISKYTPKKFRKIFNEVKERGTK